MTDVWAPSDPSHFWDNRYEQAGEANVSWSQRCPHVSLELIEAAGIEPSTPAIDVGGGGSRLVDQATYLDRLAQALGPGDTFIIGTFANDGPEQCSGLPVHRYDATALADTILAAIPTAIVPSVAPRDPHDAQRHPPALHLDHRRARALTTSRPGSSMSSELGFQWSG